MVVYSQPSWICDGYSCSQVQCLHSKKSFLNVVILFDCLIFLKKETRECKYDLFYLASRLDSRG